MTKEMAYEYLQYHKTMNSYTDSYSVVDIYFGRIISPSVKDAKHLIIKCEYKEDNIIKNKYVHASPDKLAEWIETRRQSRINEIIK